MDRFAMVERGLRTRFQGAVRQRTYHSPIPMPEQTRPEAAFHP